MCADSLLVRLLGLYYLRAGHDAWDASWQVSGPSAAAVSTLTHDLQLDCPSWKARNVELILLQVKDVKVVL